ncbi:MAG: antitoxin VapB [Symbiobacteriaceae bacterium]|jgi:antitoxin VapB|nr:antitoxin VapB [Symbiobacteriaceae bacterium]
MRFEQSTALLEAERREKEIRVQQYLAERGLGALVLTRVENFAWLTAGANNRIVTTEEAGAASLVYTADGGKYVITNISEARRMEEEEFAGLGWEVRSTRWDQSQAYLIHEALNGRRAVADTVGLPGIEQATGLQRLRYQLTEAEVERLRWLGHVTGTAVADACRLHEPGETEHVAAARVHEALAPYGVTPAVVLVASDDRIYRYRHPVPTAKPVERYLMVVLVAEKWGLHAAATRFVHFGPVSDVLRRKYEAVAAVDQAYIGATRPGAEVRSIFQAGLKAYGQVGFGDEWLLHHQGGAIGYAPREYLATAESPEVVQPNQAFAWNPSITGAKAEDTVLATPAGAEVLTAVEGWPLVGGRPGPLVR